MLRPEELQLFAVAWLEEVFEVLVEAHLSVVHDGRVQSLLEHGNFDEQFLSATTVSKVQHVRVAHHHTRLVREREEEGALFHANISIANTELNQVARVARNESVLLRHAETLVN